MLGVYSYLAAAASYGLFALLVMLSARASRFGRLFALVFIVNMLWALSAAQVAAYDHLYLVHYHAFEIVRYMAWYVFLMQMFRVTEEGRSSYRHFSQKALRYSLGLAFLLLVDALFDVSGEPVLAVIGRLMLALIGLAMIEQLYRNLVTRSRWAMKYFVIGLGAMFAFDFYIYADALRGTGGLDGQLWEARAIVHVLVIPLLAVSMSRNREWSLNVFISRDVVLHSATIIGGGVYLLFMAGAGYYVREFGGDWGRIGQVVFVALAAGALVAILLSEKRKVWFKVFLAKHFYANKYDYREEWLRLTETLSGENADADHRQRYVICIEALARMVDARAGMLWLRDERNDYQNVVGWHLPEESCVIAADESLPVFLQETAYVINIHEIKTHAYEYTGLRLPACLDNLTDAWLIVPLCGEKSLDGFIVLARPLVEREINWEDRDFLKTAARQIANHIALMRASERLAQASQFEVFSRLSAYMVHDMKNIASELEMVAKNAGKHADNAEFVRDAFDTVNNAASGIKRLLQQLRNRYVLDEKPVLINLAALLKQAIGSRQGHFPEPELILPDADCQVIAPKQRLFNVVVHLLENAQQATEDDGHIEVALQCQPDSSLIRIRDTGCGMDADFIRHRLFKPFDTTKGNAGMGIGMYESRDFVRQMGGDIHVRSQPGQGTTVTVQMPCHRDISQSVDETGRAPT